MIAFSVALNEHEKFILLKNI